MTEKWHYVRSNAGRLLLSELTAMFLPGRRQKGEVEDGKGKMNVQWMHLAWQIMRPLVYRWMGEVGWQVFKSMFRNKKNR